MIPALPFIFVAVVVAQFTGRFLAPPTGKTSWGAAAALGFAAFIFLQAILAFLLPGWRALGMACLLLLLCAVALFFLRHPRQGHRPRPYALLSTQPVRRRAQLLLLLVLMVGAWVLSRFIGMLPANYDVLSYHLPLAWWWISGDVDLFNNPPNFYARMAIGAPMLEALFVSSWAGGPFAITRPMLLAAALLAGASSAARCAAWLGARTPGRMAAAALYLFHPMLLGALLNGLTAPLVALMSIASLEFLLQGFGKRRHPRMRSLFCAAVLAATAPTLKFSAAGTAILPLGIVFLGLLAPHFPERKHLALRMVLVFAAGGLLIQLPWLVRAVMLGGHPAFPFGGESANWTPAQAEFVVGQHNPRTPFAVSYWLDFVQKFSVFGFAPANLPVSPLLVIAMLAFAQRRLRGMAELIVIACLAGYLAWLLVALNPARFLAPTVVLLVPLAGAALGRLPGSPAIRGTAAFGAFVLLLPGVAPQLLTAWVIPAVLNPEERRAYVDAEEQARINMVAREEAGRGKLLAFFEARAALFLPGSVEYTTVWDAPAWAPALKASTDAEDFANRLAAEGVTGIVVNEAEWGRLLDFYAKEANLTRTKLWGRIGVYGPLDRGTLLRYLEAYPSFQFAGFDRQQLGILLDFLVAQRAQTLMAAPAGQGAEFWFARLRPAPPPGVELQQSIDDPAVEGN